MDFSPDLHAMHQTFAEHFDTFDSAPNGIAASGQHVWSTSFIRGDRTIADNDELEYYSDLSVGADPFRTTDGILSIIASPADPGSQADQEGLTYTSGIITTARTFSQTYGYFEMRAKLPEGSGFWPAFWLLNEDQNWPPELDVVEAFGNAPDIAQHTAHSGAGGIHTQTEFEVSLLDLYAWHTYAVSWRPDAIRWYIDDTEIAYAPTPDDMHAPMYMIANLAVGGRAGDPLPGSTATMSIDYIRAYQFDDIFG